MDTQFYQRQIKKLMFRKKLNQQDAEDIVQDAFARVASSRPDLLGHLGYMKDAIDCQYLMFVRDNTRIKRKKPEPSFEIVDETQSGYVYVSEILKMIETSKVLTRTQRRVILEHIAGTLDASKASNRSCLLFARKRLEMEMR